MKSIPGYNRVNFLQRSVYRFLQMTVNYVQNLAKSLDNNLLSYPEWTSIFGLYTTSVSPAYNRNCQRIEVPLKVPLLDLY